MKPKISVIIPVYNAEEKIKQCIESLKKQTYKNYEAIFINDGSTDKSQEILKNLIDENCMKVVYQKNSGVSSARNKGIQEANGEFLSFLDVDDTYSEKFLEKMLKNIEENNSDLVMCNYLEIFNGGKKEKRLPFQQKTLQQEEILSELIPRIIGKIDEKESDIWATVWRTMIRKDFLIKTTATFDENTYYSEDFLFLIEILAQANKVSIESDEIYNYYRNQSSALNKYVENFLEKNKYIHTQIQEILKQYNLNIYVEDRYKKNQFRMYTVLISNAVRQKGIKKQIREINEIIKDFEKNNKFESILNLMNYYELISYYLLKFRCTYCLQIIYFLKEKIRTKRFF